MQWKGESLNQELQNRHIGHIEKIALVQILGLHQAWLHARLWRIMQEWLEVTRQTFDHL